MNENIKNKFEIEFVEINNNIIKNKFKEYNLSCPEKNINIIHCLEHYLQYKTTDKGRKTRLYINKLNKYLLIIIKRFQFLNDNYMKNNTDIDFDITFY